MPDAGGSALSAAVRSALAVLVAVASGLLATRSADAGCTTISDARAVSQWKYTEIPVTPGATNTAFELELYDLLNDPYELTNVADDPQHAVRITQMAARLRALRQNWPIDSDPNGPDPDEDE